MNEKNVRWFIGNLFRLRRLQTRLRNSTTQFLMQLRLFFCPPRRWGTDSQNSNEEKPTTLLLTKVKVPSRPLISTSKKNSNLPKEVKPKSLKRACLAISFWVPLRDFWRRRERDVEGRKTITQNVLIRGTTGDHLHYWSNGKGLNVPYGWDHTETVWRQLYLTRAQGPLRWVTGHSHPVCASESTTTT